MKLLKELYEISSPSGRETAMIGYITGWLQKRNIRYSIDRNGNIYAVKGLSATYPCIVAHTDEVHNMRSKNYEVVSFRGEIVFGYDRKHRRLTGIGADDKNGIWICLKCLEAFDRLKCAFFTGEETGCTGSRNADMTFFDDCRFVLQCDRKGSADIITEISGVELCSEKFLKAVKPGAYGYKAASGLPTDVFALKERGLAVSCVNISCGYYNHHTDEEYTYVRELKKCFRFVCCIIKDCRQVYSHRYTLHDHRNYGGYAMYGRLPGGYNRVTGRVPDYYDPEDVF